METMLNWWLGHVFLIAIYAFYALVLKNSTHFNWNRTYLLLAPLVAFVLPFLGPVFRAILVFIAPDVLIAESYVLPEYVVGTVQEPVTQSRLWMVYTIGVALISIRLLWSVVKLIRLLHKSSREKRGKYTLIKGDVHLSSFSFFNYIYIQSNLNKNEQQAVLQHELEHVHSGHSFDILYFELLSILLWFNPVVYVFRKAIREVHEFAADRNAAADQKNVYGKLLIAQAFDVAPATIVNPFFNQSLLKRRIMMLNRKSNNSIWKYFLIAPMACVMLYAASCTKPEDAGNAVSQKGERVFTGKEKGSLDNDSKKQRVFTGDAIKELDFAPEFEGGQKAMLTYLGEHLKYPKSAIAEGKEGVVYVSFVVNANGGIVDVEVVKGLSEALDTAAKEIIAGMPKWIPGKKDGKNINVKMTLPIRYQLKG